MELDWKKIDADNDQNFEKQMIEEKKRSAANRDYFTAVHKARNAIQNEELWPERDRHGELRYTVKQGLKAACLAREDIATTSQLQLGILRRLDRNRNLLLIVIVLLAYIAAHAK